MPIFPLGGLEPLSDWNEQRAESKQRSNNDIFRENLGIHFKPT